MAERQTTMLNNLIDPQVLGAYLDVKLIDRIKLSPLVEVNRALEGHGGSTLTLPKYAFIGTAEEVAEGVEAGTAQLTATSEDVRVKKIVKAVEITDEAKLSSYGDPVNEIGRQLLVSLADKIEKDLFAVLESGMNEAMKSTGAKFGKDAIADALVKFGEEIDEPIYMFINPKEYAELRKDADFVQIANGQAVINGHVGQIMGCQVVISARVPEGKAYFIKNGALMLVMKRNVHVEADRNVLASKDIYKVDEHYAVHLKYDDRVAMLTIG